MMSGWLLWTLLAVISWGTWALISKFIGDAITPAQSQALSTIGMLLVILLLAIARKPATALNSRRGIIIALSAGVLTCLGNTAYYYVLNSGAKAATVVTLTALYPLVTIMLAMMLLKERLNKIQMAGVLLSLVAIYFFNIPQGQGFISPWLLGALVPILLWGISGFVQKLSTNHISGELSALYFLSAFVPIGLIILWREPIRGSVSPSLWLLSAALGFTLALGNLAILKAFASNGKASIIAPLGSLYPLVSIPIAITVFHETIGSRESIGIALALAAIVALSAETQVKETANTNSQS